jgi:Fanconi anemia group M protein
MLFILAKRESEHPSTTKLHPYKSYRSLRDQQEYVVASLPGIGLKNARVLLSHFGSIADLVQAEQEAFTHIPGIGEKTARAVWEILHRAY